MKRVSLETLQNYIGQLRIYSFVDLVLLFLVVDATRLEIIGCSLLWFSFLIFLEFIHKDRGRVEWPISAWVVPFILGIVIIYKIEIIFFIITAIFYTYKKQYPLGLISPIINGLLKVFLVLLISDDINIVILVFVLMTIRNLAGDFRDAYKDFSEKITTLPILFSYKQNTNYIYPLFLAFTSLVWVLMAKISLWFILLVWFIQFKTYHLTSR